MSEHAHIPRFSIATHAPETPPASLLAMAPVCAFAVVGTDGSIEGGFLPGWGLRAPALGPVGALRAAALEPEAALTCAALGPVGALRGAVLEPEGAFICAAPVTARCPGGAFTPMPGPFNALGALFVR